MAESALEKQDPDPDQVKISDPDPHPHQGEKSDPHLHQIKIRIRIHIGDKSNPDLQPDQHQSDADPQHWCQQQQW